MSVGWIDLHPKLYKLKEIVYNIWFIEILYLYLYSQKTYTMKFYQNRTTNEIIGIEEMMDLLSHPTEQSIRLGFKGYKRSTIYKAIFPNKLLANGIVSFAIEHTFLTKNYKRINKNLVFEKYPIFKQYDYTDLTKEAENRGIEKIDVLREQTI